MIFIHSENYFFIVIYLADHPGGGILLYISHICANGQGFGPFWSENGYRLCPFWSGMGYGFRELRECMNVFIVSIPNE